MEAEIGLKLHALIKLLVCLVLLGHVGPAAAESLRLITSTTLKGAGLMDLLVPAFQKETGIDIDLEAAASGRAIRLARTGRADLIWVHAPEAEQKFIDDGYGIKRIPTMYNDYLIACPVSDPAGTKQARSISQVLQNIEKSQSTFVSRADDSGTHKKELVLWHAAGIEPFGTWYFEGGMGMLKALRKANELNAYLMIDRGTWLKHKNTVRIVSCYEGDKSMLNHYSLVLLNKKKIPNINNKASQQFINFVTSGTGKKIIADYKLAGGKLYNLYGK